MKEPVIKSAAATGAGGTRKATKRKPKRDPARAIGGGGRRVMPSRGKRRGSR